MKSRDLKELQTKTEAELRAMLVDAKSSLVSSKLEHAQQKLTNTTSMANLRADIARIMTVLKVKSNNPVGEGEKVT